MVAHKLILFFPLCLLQMMVKNIQFSISKSSKKNPLKFFCLVALLVDFILKRMYYFYLLKCLEYITENVKAYVFQNYGFKSFIPVRKVSKMRHTFWSDIPLACFYILWSSFDIFFTKQLYFFQGKNKIFLTNGCQYFLFDIEQRKVIYVIFIIKIKILYIWGFRFG